VLKQHAVEVEADVVQHAWLAETGWKSALRQTDEQPEIGSDSQLDASQ
jgi:hypothetical protein